jgi:predicted nucleotidyltransferase
MVLTKEQIQKTISEYFAGKPVKKAWLFGSYARGEADENSDVDVLIDIDYDAKVGLKYFSWHRELGSLLNKKVDVVSAGWENEYIKPFIDKEKRIIYER